MPLFFLFSGWREKKKSGIRLPHSKVPNPALLWPRSCRARSPRAQPAGNSFRWLQFDLKAIEDGLNVTVDTYPYDSVGIIPTSLLPTWVLYGAAAPVFSPVLAPGHVDSPVYPSFGPLLAKKGTSGR